MAITDILTANQKFVQGKSHMTPFATLVSGSTTAAAAASGHISYSISPNAVGSTLPGTLVGLPQSTVTASPNRLTAVIQSTPQGVGPGFLVHLYKLGTLSLTATGNQFTHDGATFPITRTWFGQTTNIPLLPLLQVTTATTVTAPIVRMRTVAGGTGYVDELGNNIVGTKTLTFPNAATATNSGFILPLEDGDSGILNVAAIEVTTASTTGAATIWGMEIISPIGSPDIAASMIHDAITGGLTMHNLQPGAATSGTATSILTTVVNTNASRNFAGFISGVIDS